MLLLLPMAVIAVIIKLTSLFLKGYGTLIASGESVTVNPTGSPAMGFVKKSG